MSEQTGGCVVLGVSGGEMQSEANPEPCFGWD
jgi:hypothetical protein